MKTEASYTATLVVQKPEFEGHFWVSGDYGPTTKITCVSHVSEEEAKAKIREFARRLLEATE